MKLGFLCLGILNWGLIVVSALLQLFGVPLDNSELLQWHHETLGVLCLGLYCILDRLDKGR
jgi:hypothetical protein